MHMAPTPTFDLHNRVLGGRLPALIFKYKDSDRLSFADVAFALRSHGVEVDPATVRRWYMRLKAENAA